MKHKYYDAIVAWANGEKIQYKDYRGWVDYQNDCEYPSAVPSFNDSEYVWRVKPKAITKKYRMALVYGDCNSKEIVALDLSSYTLDFTAEREVEGFLRWVGDTVEMEVEV